MQLNDNICSFGDFIGYFVHFKGFKINLIIFRFRGILVILDILGHFIDFWGIFIILEVLGFFFFGHFKGFGSIVDILEVLGTFWSFKIFLGYFRHS